jgi:polyhydroxyalkanoate synthesis regulator phasin
MSDLIELLLHLDGRNREIGCKAAARIKELESERDIAVKAMKTQQSFRRNEIERLSDRVKELEIRLNDFADPELEAERAEF